MYQSKKKLFFKVGDLLINQHKEIAVVICFTRTKAKEIMTWILVCANNKKNRYYPLYEPEKYWKLLK